MINNKKTNHSRLKPIVNGRESNKNESKNNWRAVCGRDVKGKGVVEFLRVKSGLPLRKNYKFYGKTLKDKVIGNIKNYNFVLALFYITSKVMWKILI